MKAKHLHAIWEEVDLQVIKGNIDIIPKYTKTPLMAVVKASGYGLGFISNLRIGDEVVLIGT